MKATQRTGSMSGVLVFVLFVCNREGKKQLGWSSESVSVRSVSRLILMTP